MAAFNVTVKDKATGKQSVLRVGGGENIATAEQAAEHVRGMAPSIGGAHPGFEVIEAVAEGKEEQTA